MCGLQASNFKFCLGFKLQASKFAWASNFKCCLGFNLEKSEGGTHENKKAACMQTRRVSARKLEGATQENKKAACMQSKRDGGGPCV